MYKYLEKVLVKGVDQDGHKELFDDFIGEYINTISDKILVSNGVSIYHVDPSQVTKLNL